MGRLLLALVICVATLLAACGLSKTPTELAAESLNQGIEAHNAGRTDEAIGLYYLTLSRDPKNMLAFHNLGQIARAQNRPAVAEGYYRQALEVNPNFGPALFGLAVVRSGQGGVQPQEPIELYRKVILIEPNNAAAHYNLGLLLRITGQVAEGEAEIARARQLDPSLSAPGPLPTPAATPTPTATPRPSPSPTR